MSLVAAKKSKTIAQKIIGVEREKDHVTEAGVVEVEIRGVAVRIGGVEAEIEIENGDPTVDIETDLILEIDTGLDQEIDTDQGPRTDTGGLAPEEDDHGLEIGDLLPGIGKREADMEILRKLGRGVQRLK